jgi:hypothetical protein
MGVILFTLIHMTLPYDGFDDVELIRNIKKGSVCFKKALALNKSIECIDLMKRMLYKSHGSRCPAR